MPVNYSEILRKNVEDFLSARNITKRDLAERMGTPPGDLYNILNGKIRSPGLLKLASIADAMEVPVHALLQPGQDPTLTRLVSRISLLDPSQLRSLDIYIDALTGNVPKSQEKKR